MNTANKYKIGLSKVKVFSKNERGQSSQIHQGVVVGENYSFVRVFNPESTEKNGESNVCNSQWYAKNAPRSWVEDYGELKTSIVLPADL